MKQDPQRDVEEQFKGLRARIAELEERHQSRSTAPRRALAWAAGATALAIGALATQTVYSQASCAQFLPAPLVTLCANAPAKASDVNGNFGQLATWLEQKVGTLGDAKVHMQAETRIQTGGTSNAAYAAGKALVVSGAIGAASNGVEVLHDNLTQGIGIGYNTIYTTGTTTNQDLNLAARGTGEVRVNGKPVGYRGVTYTRWGASSCPRATTLYTGYMAGGYYQHTGGTSSFLCLHNNPQFLGRTAGEQGGALIYKAEFETALSGISELASVHDDDARCAVCEVPRNQVLVIAGRINCPNGWTEEYEGYLMSDRYNHARNSETLCVARYPSTGLNTGNENGALLYPIEFGNRPVAGYAQGDEIACVLCTK